MKTTLLTSWMHLGDEVLAAAALQLHNGDTPLLSRAAHAHLEQCARCAARLDDLHVILATQRQRAAECADARFPESTLEAQRERIFTRLAERYAGARVLMFPSTVTYLPRPHRPGMRWIAATLAAGLLVGAATGQVLYTRDLLVSRVSPPVRHISRQQPKPRWTAIAGPDAQPGDERDERFLAEIESALAKGRRNPALRALDEMTPRVPGAEPRRHRER